MGPLVDGRHAAFINRDKAGLRGFSAGFLGGNNLILQTSSGDLPAPGTRRRRAAHFVFFKTPICFRIRL